MAQEPLPRAGIPGENDPTDDIGVRGVIVYGRPGADPSTFHFVNEKTWRASSPYLAADQTGPLKSLVDVKVAFARVGASVFVDLDQLKLEPSVPPANPPAPRPGDAPTDESIILREADKLYVVPAASWSLANLEISGDAGVLIDRGAVLAPIPKAAIAEGTFCVLVNLAALAPI